MEAEALMEEGGEGGGRWMLRARWKSWRKVERKKTERKQMNRKEQTERMLEEGEEKENKRNKQR